MPSSSAISLAVCASRKQNARIWLSLFPGRIVSVKISGSTSELSIIPPRQVKSGNVSVKDDESDDMYGR